MISKSARDGFDYLLAQALKASLQKSAEDTCDISAFNEMSAIKETRIAILTISSHLFRLMILIYFTPDDATKEHYARLNGMRMQDMNEQSFYDAVGEYGNICCGIFNRDLGQFFSHIDMSTPNIIDKNCASYLNVLGCGHIRHFTVNLNNSFSFPVSLCVCDHADLDFSVKADDEEAATGELEFF
ncbi:MAG: hypothetical protein ACHP7O_00205 [Burkholderiales bacterium]